MKKSKPNPKANRNILWFVYAAVFLFLAMGIYVGYFLVVKSDTVIDNPYNARAKDRYGDGFQRHRGAGIPIRQPVCPRGRIFGGGKDRDRIPGKL